MKWILNLIDKLKQTQEIKLILAGLLVVIFFFWGLFKDNYGDLKQRIHTLELEGIKKDSARETLRIIMQDKLDQCKDEKLKNLEQMLIVSEKFKKISKIK